MNRNYLKNDFIQSQTNTMRHILSNFEKEFLEIENDFINKFKITAINKDLKQNTLKSYSYLSLLHESLPLYYEAIEKNHEDMIISRFYATWSGNHEDCIQRNIRSAMLRTSPRMNLKFKSNVSNIFYNFNNVAGMLTVNVGIDISPIEGIKKEDEFKIIYNLLLKLGPEKYKIISFKPLGKCDKLYGHSGSWVIYSLALLPSNNYGHKIADIAPYGYLTPVFSIEDIEERGLLIYPEIEAEKIKKLEDYVNSIGADFGQYVHIKLNISSLDIFTKMSMSFKPSYELYTVTKNLLQIYKNKLEYKMCDEILSQIVQIKDEEELKNFKQKIENKPIIKSIFESDKETARISTLKAAYSNIPNPELREIEDVITVKDTFLSKIAPITKPLNIDELETKYSYKTPLL